MEYCIYCEAETILYDCGEPLCVECDEKREHGTLGPRLPQKKAGLKQEDPERASAGGDSVSDSASSR